MIGKRILFAIVGAVVGALACLVVLRLLHLEATGSLVGGIAGGVAGAFAGRAAAMKR